MSAIDHGKKQIVILGGGFGGVYTAMKLESLLKNHDDVEITLVNRDNYFVFQPMLAEVVSGGIGLLDIVSPIHRLLPRTRLYIRGIEAVDLTARTVSLAPDFWPESHVLSYDHLVLALGTVTDFRGMPGLPDHAFPFKNIADAIELRNHLIHVLEAARVQPSDALRQQLLTFVIAGGGFSGVEVAAELNDYVRKVARRLRLGANSTRVILIHSGERILERELDERLSRYAQQKLADRGVEFRLKRRLAKATPDAAVLDDGERIMTKTLVSTIPASPNPVIEELALAKKGGRVEVDSHFRAPEVQGVWAVGDCANYRYSNGKGVCPPTAQHAIREAEVVAHNIVASLSGGPLRELTFTGLGQMGSLGHHSAVAELFGQIRISGFLAWAFWRAVYWSKLPGFDRKLRVGLSWLLDLLIPPETVQLKLGASQGLWQVHYEAGETIIRDGELGDTLYMILKGEVEIVVERDGQPPFRRRLRDPAYFGEMALLGNRVRWGTVSAITPTDLAVLHRREFEVLMTNLPALRETFEQESQKRRRDAVMPQTDSVSQVEPD
jgi:NADH:ubiquinone reductase (H+-translocating)